MKKINLAKPFPVTLCRLCCMVCNLLGRGWCPLMSGGSPVAFLCGFFLNPPLRQLITKLANQLISHPISQPSESASQTASETIGHLANYPTSQPVNQLSNQQASNELTEQPTSQSTNQSALFPLCQRVKDR